MAKYREYLPQQTRLLPIALSHQIQPGTIEYSINYLIDHHVDLSVFGSRYRNDETGAPAIDPAILLKVILFAYSRGIISSRRIAQACEENVVFMALSADTRPHFTTIAEFISSMSDEISSVFGDILTVCYAEGLIGKRMFAVDGCKISSNCSKEWSGTKKELLNKAERIERSVSVLVKRHREEDKVAVEAGQREKEKRGIKNLRRKAEKIRSWLEQNEEKRGTRGAAIKSNIIDNDSAKLHSSHGVIQGYDGIATVDDKHQVIVDAQAFGDGHEAKHLEAVVDSVKRTLESIEGEKETMRKVVITADSGFHSEESLGKLFQRGLDAYVADTKFRQRGPRFTVQQEHKKKSTEGDQISGGRKFFHADEFHFDESRANIICPAGSPMKVLRHNWRDMKKGYSGKTYIGFEQNCSVCELRSRCIRKSSTKARLVTKIDKGIRYDKKSATQKMIERFDSQRGRFYYSRRMGTAEPAFANIRYIMGMDRFTLRGRTKVDIQWKLFCIVHNIAKLTRYAMT
jgi:transposase